MARTITFEVYTIDELDPITRQRVIMAYAEGEDITPDDEFTIEEKIRGKQLEFHADGRIYYKHIFNIE